MGCGTPTTAEIAKPKDMKVTEETCATAGTKKQTESETRDIMKSEQNTNNSYNKNTDRYKDSDLISNNDKHTSEILTEDQKQCIRKCWKKLYPNYEELGLQIFLRIFEQTPTLVALFPFNNQKGDALRRNGLFQAHSFRFMQIIESAVENLDDLDNGLVPVAVNLGKIHQRKSVSFAPHYFHSFENAVIYIWNKEIGKEFTVEARKAWTVLFAFIVKRLKEGYEQAEKCK